jgi:hypothetical protein
MSIYKLVTYFPLIHCTLIFFVNNKCSNSQHGAMYKSGTDKTNHNTRIYFVFLYFLLNVSIWKHRVLENPRKATVYNFRRTKPYFMLSSSYAPCLRDVKAMKPCGSLPQFFLREILYYVFISWNIQRKKILLINNKIRSVDFDILLLYKVPDLWKMNGFWEIWNSIWVSRKAKVKFIWNICTDPRYHNPLKSFDYRAISEMKHKERQVKNISLDYCVSLWVLQENWM